MLQILYDKAQEETFKNEVLTHFDGQDIKAEIFNSETIAQLPEKVKLITYLGDSDLKQLLIDAADKEWELGILPHPGLEYVQRGLGVTSKMDKAIEAILDESQSTEIDLLLCNEKPVLQSVKTGSIFLIDETNAQSNLLLQIFRIFKNTWRVKNLKHKAFKLSVGEENSINTSALGIVALAQAGSIALSRKIKSFEGSNVGFFNVLIVSPQSVLEMLLFLIKGILPGRHRIDKEDSFIGYIKTKTLNISSETNIDFSIDGEKFTAENISIEVKPKAIHLLLPSIFTETESSSDNKNSFKTENLPYGEKKEELTKRKMPWLPRATPEEFKELFTALRLNARLNKTYIVLMAISTIMATFGLYGNSSPVIIGAMILAPLMPPIVSFSMAIVRYDVSILKDSSKTILLGTVLSLLFAAFVSIIIPLRIITPEMDMRLSPTLLDLGIAVASGIAGAYAHAKEEIAKSLAGVAIAVALVPPLAVAGIGVGWMDWSLFSGSFLLYLTNLSGIIMSAGFTFLLLGFAPFKRARRGLIYSFVLLALICVPLSFSFKQIMTEAEITKALEGYKIENVTIKDVKVRPSSPVVVSVRLVSSSSLDDSKIGQIKTKIEKRLDREIKLEVISAVVF
ncbi:MAG: TIGR00341 family protein [Chitinophagales bacterium]